MSIKSKLVTFFAASALLAAVSAHAQTTTTPDPTAAGMAPVTPPGAPAGNLAGTGSDTTQAAPGVSNPGALPTAPGPGSDGTSVAPPPASPNGAVPPSTSMSPSSTSTPPDGSTNNQ